MCEPSGRRPKEGEDAHSSSCTPIGLPRVCSHGGYLSCPQKVAGSRGHDQIKPVDDTLRFQPQLVFDTEETAVSYFMHTIVTRSVHTDFSATALVKNVLRELIQLD